jgi:type VI secretion system protein ImpH
MATARGGSPTPVNPEPILPTSSSLRTKASQDAPAASEENLGGNRIVSSHPARTLAQCLFDEPYAFNFFQAVRLLEKVYPQRRPIGRSVRPEDEIVRFAVRLSMASPPSQIHDLEVTAEGGPAVMTVAFMGLTGPQGVLPLHYTDLLLRLNRDARGPERRALRDWFDLFNHRLISLFFRAWEKYRFYIPYERGEYAGKDPDPFTRCLFSFIGLEASPARRRSQPIAISPLRNRLRVSTWSEDEEGTHEQVLTRIDDLALLHYSGYLAHRPRCAMALQALLQDYFQVPVAIKQFLGQWLIIEPASQSSMGDAVGNNELGLNVVAGERVWDAQSKFRVRIGPLRLSQFMEFLPDRSPVAQRKTFFLLSHLARLYIGPEFDFDVQLILKAEDVPACQLTDGVSPGPRLGWNTWIQSQPMDHDAEDAAFEGQDLVWVNGAPPGTIL